jgi:hypothetical protein
MRYDRERSTNWIGLVIQHAPKISCVGGPNQAITPSCVQTNKCGEAVLLNCMQFRATDRFGPATKQKMQCDPCRHRRGRSFQRPLYLQRRHQNDDWRSKLELLLDDLAKTKARVLDMHRTLVLHAVSTSIALDSTATCLKALLTCAAFDEQDRSMQGQSVLTFRYLCQCVVSRSIPSDNSATRCCEQRKGKRVLPHQLAQGFFSHTEAINLGQTQATSYLQMVLI